MALFVVVATLAKNATSQTAAVVGVRSHMDILSLSVGFLVGAITGAAGNYLADKYTDVRRDKKAAKEQTKLWREIEAQFPGVIADMRQAFTSSEGKYIRAFFVKESGTMIGFLSEPCFEFHTDEHPDLHAAVLHLARHEFITDITPGNCPMYRVHEKLIDWLMKPNNSFKPKASSDAA